MALKRLILSQSKIIFNSNSKDETNLYLYYLNAHSIIGKVSQLNNNLYLFTTQTDILVIAKSWLQSFVSSSENGLIGYDMFRCDRDLAALCPARRGGVLSATKKSFHAELITCFTSSLYEQLFIKFSTYIGKFIIGASYF